jgi:acetoin utilization deacetylase AcuC-like enzyme
MIHVVYDSKCLDYNTPNHPESPLRVKLITSSLRALPSVTFTNPASYPGKYATAVHGKLHINKLRSSYNPFSETPITPHTYKYAKKAVDCAITAANLCLTSGATFSLTRPPGHHAGKNSISGFCYLNNLVIAANYLIEEKDTKRIAILDIDVHHGNGTQDLVLGNQRYLYASIHQHPLYPGTGITDNQNCLNRPLSPGTRGPHYQVILSELIARIKAFKPEVLAVSIGFDTFSQDPLANFNLDIQDFHITATLINSLDLPTYYVLEGGYSNKVGDCAASFFSGIA